ncbi:hypothetical protein VN0786_09330 [Helicobacter pylori]
MKIKFKRLDYQEKCLNQILGVFKGIYLREPENDAQRISNPVFEIEAIKDLLLENIQNLRSEQKITQGSVGIDKSLNCDILMETGTREDLLLFGMRLCLAPKLPFVKIYRFSAKQRH